MFHEQMIYDSKNILRNLFYRKCYSSLWRHNFQSWWNCSKYVILCAICCYLYNLKIRENTHGGVSLLVKLQAVIKVTLLHGCFSHFLNCANGTKSRKASHIKIWISQEQNMNFPKENRIVSQILYFQKLSFLFEATFKLLTPYIYCSRETNRTFVKLLFVLSAPLYFRNYKCDGRCKSNFNFVRYDYLW